MTTKNAETTRDSADPVGPSEPGVERPSITRREALSGLAFGSTVGISGLASAPAFGRDDPKKPAEQVTIGVIGFGPRCTYVMNAMLGLPDVRCVAIADVQKSRLESGKALVDKLSGNTDCVTYGDIRKLLERKDTEAVVVATGDRWHLPVQKCCPPQVGGRTRAARGRATGGCHQMRSASGMVLRDGRGRRSAARGVTTSPRA